MKKILILSILFLSILGLTSCSQDEIETYKETDNIYFSPAEYRYGINAPYIDSTGFSFGFKKASITEQIYKIPIRVQGNISNVDRKIKLTVDPTSTAIEGTHFTLPDNIVLRAGKEVDTVAVTVKRTPDMKTNSFTLVLNLEENEFFTTRMESKIVNILTGKTMSYVRFKLSFDDKFGQPKGWFVPYYGTFSEKKFFLMCDLIGLDPVIFDQNPGSPGLSVSEMGYYQNFMRRYLADQKAAGNTIYEENGSEMIFP